MCWSPVVVVVRSKSHTKSTEQPPVGGCGWWTGEQWVSSETNSYLICLVRTLFNESFHVTHATPSTVCQKIPSLKKVSPLCQLLQPRNEYGPHQSPSGWRWSIPGRWHMVTPWEIPSWYDSRCDLRKLWNFRKPFLTCLTCLRFSLIIEVVYIYTQEVQRPNFADW